MDYVSIFGKVYALTESSNPVWAFIGLQALLYRQHGFVAIDGDGIADVALIQVCHGVTGLLLVGDCPQQSPGTFQALACDWSFADIEMELMLRLTEMIQQILPREI